MPRTLHFPDNATSWRECAWSCGVIIDDRIFFTSDTQFDRELVDDDEGFAIHRAGFHFVATDAAFAITHDAELSCHVARWIQYVEDPVRRHTS